VWGLVAIGGPLTVALVYGIFKLHSLAVIWLTLRHAPNAEVHAGMLSTRVRYQSSRGSSVAGTNRRRMRKAGA
jgi:hypothetical protein